MSENHGTPFIARLRSTGQKQTSLIVTVDKEVTELLDLHAGDLVEMRIKKAKRVVK